jgi:integrase
MKKHERFIEAHPKVKDWLKNRPESTRKIFAVYLEQFCNGMQIEPEEWRNLDKFEARDLAWKFIEPKIAEHSAVAKSTLIALKSWYRNKDGEQLPFDSGRGGKHYLHVKHKKASIEHIPNKKEIFQIIDMASSLRDKAILLFLFQSGVRVNVLQHMKYGDVQDQLDKDLIALKITGELDHKLRGRDIPFYYTFLNGEATETLRQYCQTKDEQSTLETPLFSAKDGKSPLAQQWIWRVVKMCVERAGFNPKSITTHTFRKSFRKIVRQTDIDDDDKEQLMGHVISGSRQAYYDRKDVDLIRKAYQKCNFQREVPESEVTKLRKQLEDEQSKRVLNEVRMDKLEKELETTRKLLTQILENKE